MLCYVMLSLVSVNRLQPFLPPVTQQRSTQRRQRRHERTAKRQNNMRPAQLSFPFLGKAKRKLLAGAVERMYMRTAKIGPLQLAIHVVQNCRAAEQKSHWDKTNKENYHSKLCMSFVCLVPVRLLLFSVAILCHVNG